MSEENRERSPDPQDVAKFEAWGRDNYSDAIFAKNAGGCYVYSDAADLFECWLAATRAAEPSPSTAREVDAEAERKLFEREANDARFFPREIDFTLTKSPSGRDAYENSHLQSRWEGWLAKARTATPSAAAGPARKPSDEDVSNAVRAFVNAGKRDYFAAIASKTKEQP
jgi:hypothetical protein